jgi:hypothetical protein
MLTLGLLFVIRFDNQVSIGYEVVESLLEQLGCLQFLWQLIALTEILDVQIVIFWGLLK